MNVSLGWIFSGWIFFQRVNIFQGWIFFRWIFYRGEYFWDLILFRGEYFSRVNIFQEWIFFRGEYFQLWIILRDEYFLWWIFFRGEYFSVVNIWVSHSGTLSSLKLKKIAAFGLILSQAQLNPSTLAYFTTVFAGLRSQRIFPENIAHQIFVLQTDVKLLFKIISLALFWPDKEKTKSFPKNITTYSRPWSRSG